MLKEWIILLFDHESKFEQIVENRKDRRERANFVAKCSEIALLCVLRRQVFRQQNWKVGKWIPRFFSYLFWKAPEAFAVI